MKLTITENSLPKMEKPISYHLTTVAKKHDEIISLKYITNFGKTTFCSVEQNKFLIGTKNYENLKN